MGSLGLVFISAPRFDASTALFWQLNRLRECSIDVRHQLAFFIAIGTPASGGSPLRDISWCARVLGADDDASSGFAVNFVRATHPTLEGTAVTRDK
jgi:hypothetical protein